MDCLENTLPEKCDGYGDVPPKNPSRNNVQSWQGYQQGVAQVASKLTKADVDQLPFEILAYVFELYIHAGGPVSRFDSPMGPFPLGAVCRKWRHIAWTSPQLWSSLVFRIHNATAQKQIQLAIDWINRSGQQPLSIRLSTYIDWPTVENSGSQNNIILLLNPLLDVVSRSLDRCHHLGLFTIPQSIFFRVSRASVRATALEHLALRAADDSGQLDLSFAAPKVLQMHHTSLSAFTMNWTNLTEFWVAWVSADDVFQVLALAPQLVTCHIQGLTRNVHTMVAQISRSPVVCPALESLFVCPAGYIEDVTSELLRSATCPKLTGFSVDDDLTLRPSVVLDFLLRSRCPLTVLSVGEEICSGGDLVRIATACPSITTLLISKMKVYGVPPPSISSFYHALCLDHYPPNCPVLLPRLIELDIETRQPFPWSMLPSLRYSRCYSDDGTVTHTRIDTIRPDIESISISWELSQHDHGGASSRASSAVPAHLIQSWEIFSALVKLSNEIAMRLLVGGQDLAFLSYTALECVAGSAPEDVKKFMDCRAETFKLKKQNIP